MSLSHLAFITVMGNTHILLFISTHFCFFLLSTSSSSSFYYASCISTTDLRESFFFFSSSIFVLFISNMYVCTTLVQFIFPELQIFVVESVVQFYKVPDKMFCLFCKKFSFFFAIMYMKWLI